MCSRGTWTVCGGEDSACSESAVTGLSQSCCPLEPLGLAAASWEARGSRARLWGGVEALLGFTVPEGEHGKVFHQERRSCQDQGKDQVVGEQEQTPGWLGLGMGRETCSHFLLPICCSINPPHKAETQGGNREP